MTDRLIARFDGCRFNVRDEGRLSLLENLQAFDKVVLEFLA